MTFYKNSIGLLPVLALLFTACTTRPNTPAEELRAEAKNRSAKAPVTPSCQKGRVLKGITCIQESPCSYALYLPASYDSAKNIPLILIFDPHAQVALPLYKYRAVAEKYGIALACSGNISNGMPWEAAHRYAAAMLSDLTTRLGIDSGKIYALGFSGGARTAGLWALNDRRIAGIIACSAGFEEYLSPASAPFSVFSMCGDADINFHEVKYFDSALGKRNFPHRLFVFQGKHEWPPAAAMDVAFRWMVSGRQISFRASETALLSPEGMIEIPAKSVQEEMELREQLKNSLTDKDTSWWKEKVIALHAAADKKTQLSNSRALAFVSMLCYMQVSSSLSRGDRLQAAYFLDRYRIADPSNADVYYLDALLLMRLDQKTNALRSLARAVDLGFNNYSLLRNEPVFTALHGDTEFEAFVIRAEKNETTPTLP